MLAGLFLLACITPALAIRNGTPESSPQYSGVGKITVTNQLRGTGVLISRNCVLTSASVGINLSPNSAFVFELDAQHSATVTAIRVHPDFGGEVTSTLAFDVAVLLLDPSQTQGWDPFVRSTVRTIPMSVARLESAWDLAKAQMAAERVQNNRVPYK